MTEPENFKDAELDHLLGPYKRIHPTAEQKHQWIERIRWDSLSGKAIYRKRRIFSSPYMFVMGSNLALMAILLFSLPLVNTYLGGYEITMEVSERQREEACRHLTSLPVLQGMNVLNRPFMNNRSSVITLIYRGDEFNMKGVEEAILTSPYIKRLRMTPILLKEKKRLISVLGETFLIKSRPDDIEQMRKKAIFEEYANRFYSNEAPVLMPLSTLPRMVATPSRDREIERGGDRKNPFSSEDIKIPPAFKNTQQNVSLEE